MGGRLPLLVLLCTAQFVDVLDINAVLVALPAIGRDLGLSGGGLQWVVTAYVLVFAGCLLVAGRLADLYGRRRVFASGLALFTVTSLACGLAPTAESLVAARAAQGLGAALTAPAALALIVGAFPAGRQRERAVAVWTGVAAVGGATGLVLGGVVAGELGWRWIFLVNVPVGLATLALTPRLVPGDARTGNHAAPALDLPGAAAATSGLALLVLALAEAERGGPLEPLPLAAAAAAALLLTAFARRERRARDPLVPPALLSRRPVVAATLAAALLTACTSGGGVLATLHLQDDLGLGPSAAGLVLVPFSVAVVAGSAAASRLRAPVGGLIAGGFVLVAAGAVAAAAASGRWSIVAWGVLTGLGLGAASVAATSAGTSSVDDHERGIVAGILNTAAQVGTAVGIAALVLLAGASSRTAAYAATAALAAAAALLLAAGTPRSRVPERA
jgi:MFS family permease